MFVGKRIKELREEKGMVQRQLAAALEIDSPMYSKIERGERRAKREQVIELARIFEIDVDELLTLWLAGQIYEIIKDEKVAKATLSFVEMKL
ncbi:helix-turn-helix domain-containing protein [Plebeiibacterium marinum]|uniref:Helix-turn-helix domain-containing protein n=1 Tax=Plebeiibacterium marinum TaxID=2992111 RepID=A0AAE3SJS6_9BACT|nr:helix-turn-helix transcriptional regulator [Plebeiobacterium marinum]MCW3805733.1 helix-turn-helix domain-containing protein [Plebeiobacterium marinum]